jgi:hypothetical protein
MSGEKMLYLGIGVVLGWLVLPMVLGVFKGKTG